MNCLNTVVLPFSTTISVPAGYYYNDDNQLSFAVSTDDLNLYVAENSFRTDDLKNPCTGENIKDMLVTIIEVRMSGTVAFRVGLNDLVSSYNFILGSQANVNDDGWSSGDGFIPIKVMDGLVEKNYIVVGYLDSNVPPVPPTRDDIIVVLESFAVKEHNLTEGTILEVTGEISFKLSV